MRTLFVPAFGTACETYYPWFDMDQVDMVRLDGWTTTGDQGLVTLGAAPVARLVEQVVLACRRNHGAYALCAHSTGAALVVRALARLAADRRPAHVVLYDPVVRVQRYPRWCGYLPLPTWLLRWSPVPLPWMEVFRSGEYHASHATRPLMLYETWHGLCSDPLPEAMGAVPVMVSCAPSDPLVCREGVPASAHTVACKMYPHQTYRAAAVVLAVQKWIDAMARNP